MNKKEYIFSDNKFFNELGMKTRIRLHLTNDHWILIRRYLQYLRRQEYYMQHGGFFGKILSIFWGRKKNNLGNKLGFHIPAYTLGTSSEIYHHGAITINGDAKIGNNCKLHGMNCIGNNGKDTRAPIIGNNVDIGVGAKIIGGIVIADNIKIGANALVTKDCLIEGCTLVGIPAVPLKID